MATLASTAIKDTYPLLLKIDSTGVDGTLRKVEDGDGTDSSLLISTTAIAIDATDKLYFDGGTHTYIDESAADIMDFFAGGVHMLSLDKTNTEVVINEGSADINFRVESNGNANALFVDGSANNIGIGTSSPAALASLYIQGNGTGSTTNAWLYIDGAQDSGLKILDGGTMRWEIFNATGAADRLYIRDEESDTGVYIAQDATDWTSLSDISLKTDITSISNALSKVNSIRGVNFKWKKYKPDGSKPIPSRDRNRIGCIAQEVNEVLPEAVDSVKDGEWGVSYSTLIPLIIEAVKELSVSNNALKARIEILEAA
tara:strand:+ start:421 stop:1362 length:942 start_codon:yes stop_codon:yes gene_type:complete